MLRPYYDHDGITIYHGDCREVMYDVEADVLITDPPYGVNLGSSDDGLARDTKHGLHKPAYPTYEDSFENYVAVVVPAIAQALMLVRRGAVFTGPNLWELPKADAIAAVFCPAAHGRTTWGFKTVLPVLLYGTVPGLQKGARVPVGICSTAAAEENGHPCPKPIEWMRWLVSLASIDSDVIFDPFMGSGTTLRAAKDLGRRAIGVEIEERYCEIAAKRLSQGVLPMFDRDNAS